MAKHGFVEFHDGLILKLNRESTTSVKLDINGSPTSSWELLIPNNPPPQASSLTFNSSGVGSWQPLGGGGTVTSVGLNAVDTNIFNVTNSPVISNGVINLAYKSQPANTVLLAPNGTDGTPSFRLLIPADIPNLTVSKLTDFNSAVQSIVDTAATGAMVYKGTVDASAANPTAAGVLTPLLPGHRYRVAVPGNTAFGIPLNAFDFVTYNGASWDKTDNTDPSVTGTASRVTVTPTGDINYTVDIANNYAGQSSITTLGTIATGEWQGTTIAANKLDLSSRAKIFTGSFTAAALTAGQLVITHSLGNQFPNVVFYDNDNKVIYPDEIIGTSATVLTADFSTYNTPTPIVGTYKYTITG